MNSFTIIILLFAVLGLDIVSSQRNWSPPSPQPIYVECDRLTERLYPNVTWTCQRRPCKERPLSQESHTPYNEYNCNLNDNSEICCPVYPEHKGEGNVVVPERERPLGPFVTENDHNKRRPETTLFLNKGEGNVVAAEREKPSVTTEREYTRKRPETTLFSSTYRAPTSVKNTVTSEEDYSLIRELQSKRFSKFDRDLLSELARENPNKNVIISPASIKSLLALLVEGSSDETAAEILKLLQLKPDVRDRKKSISLLRKLQSLLKNDRTTISLESQNRIYRARNVTLKEEYETILTSVYRAGVEVLDFSKPEQAAATINNWIKDVTRGLIPKVVEEDNIHEDTKLFLLNYIYLKASWDTAFNPIYTRTRCFYPTEKECQQVKFMNKKRQLNYTDSAEFKSEIFEIPFKDPRYTIVFMLPHKDSNPYNVLKSLDRKDLFELFKKLEEESINLSIPRTVIGFNSNLVQPLQQLGVRSIFERSAKLTNMLKKNAHFSVTDIVHKARIELNEEGAEASGISGANIQTLSLDVDRVVMVDRPFLFFIRDTVVNGFLFEGMVFSPDRAE